MKKTPRRPQPSILSWWGRRIIRTGNGGIILSGIGIFALFIALTLPVLLLLFSPAEPQADTAQAPETTMPTISVDSPGAQQTFLEKLFAIEEGLRETLTSLGISAPDSTLELTASQPMGGSEFQYKYYEVILPPDILTDRFLTDFRAGLIHRVPRIAIKEIEFDSKTHQVIVKVEGVSTHTIIVSRSREEVDDQPQQVKPTPEPKTVPEWLKTGGPKIALIIDDIGYRSQIDKKFLEIDAELTFSILPYSPGGLEFARTAHDLGREIMLHMPMEPIDYPAKKPGEGALYVTTSSEEITKLIDQALDSVPYVSGINNHMGSRFTQVRPLMAVFLDAIDRKNLYFIDSRTYLDSIAYDMAQEISLPSAVRNVFLDHDPEFVKVAEKIGELAAIANRKGFAVGIGHPHMATLEALKVYIPGLQQRGIQVVSASKIVH